MSLISDALRRARQDTGRLDSGPRLPGPLRPPSRRRSGLTVVLVAVLAAVVGAGAVWLVVRRSALAPVEDRAAMPRATVPITASGGERQSGAGAPVVGETPGGSTPQAAAPGVTGAAGPAPAGEAKRGERYEPETAQRSPGTGASVAEPSGGVAPGTGAAGQPVTGAPQTARAATESVAAGGSGDSRSMAPGHLEKLEGTLARPPGSGVGSQRHGGPREIVGEGTVDGVKLTLDYLVYRSKDPFAQINGVEAHVGSEVDGFTVLSIEEDRVRLQSKHGPVILRVH